MRLEHAGGLPDPPSLRLWLLRQSAAVGAFPHRLSDGTGQEPDGDSGEFAPP